MTYLSNNMNICDDDLKKNARDCEEGEKVYLTLTSTNLKFATFGAYPPKSKDSQPNLTNLQLGLNGANVFIENSLTIYRLELFLFVHSKTSVLSLTILHCDYTVTGQ